MNGDVPNSFYGVALYTNYIKTKRELKIFYKKSTGVLSKIISGNIKKEGLKLKELAKGNR